MKPWAKATIAVVLVLLVAYGSFSAAMGSMNPKDWFSLAGNQSSSSSPTATVAPSSTFQQINMNDRGYDDLNVGNLLSDSVNFQINYYSLSSDGNYMLLGTGASGTATIEVTPSDGGYIYASVVPRSGQAYYVDVKDTLANNPNIVGVNYFDINNNGYNDFVFKVNVAGLPQPIGQNAQLWLYPYFIAMQAPTLNTLSNIDSIGTAATTEYLQWQATFANAMKGFAMTKVSLTLNTTDLTQVALNDINIPGVGYLSGATLGTPNVGATTLTWTWTANPANLNGADYITLSTNQLNQFAFTTSVTCTLSTHSDVAVTLNIYGVDQNGASVAAISDTVVLSE
jgi:hypothetical protein